MATGRILTIDVTTKVVTALACNQAQPGLSDSIGVNATSIAWRNTNYTSEPALLGLVTR